MKTTKEKLFEIFKQKIGHPSRWDETNHKNALIMLAEAIDKLNESHE